MGVERIAAAFPSQLAADVAAVCAVVPPATTQRPTPADIGAITLAGERLRIPQRIYWAEPTENAARSLRERERLILSAIYSRHHDGFVRERALREVIRSREQFVQPFIVQLLGEYVLEIIQIIEAELPEPILADYAAFLEGNVEFLELTRARATSYWNAYARSQFPRLREYPALRVLDRLAFWTSR